MKIEYVEVPLEDVLKFYEKHFRANTGRVRHFGKPLIDPVVGVVCFRLYLDNDEEWDRLFHQKEVE